MEDLKLVTVEELAEKLRVRNSWIYSRTRETGTDAMPRLKVGKYLRFVFADVLGWIERQNRLDR